MKKWLKVGGALMFAAWLPFLYAELTSEPTERKGRALPTEEVADEPVAAQAADEGDEGRAGEPAAAPAQPAPPTPPTPEPPAAAALLAPSQVAADPTATAEDPPPPTAPGTANDQVAEGDAPPEAEDEPEPVAPPPSGPVAVLKRAFDGQPRDALWATDAEGKLRSLFGTEDVPASLLAGASCRKAVCRLEVQWTPEHAAAYVSVYQASTALSGGELGVEPIDAPDDSGAQRVHLYLTRQGYTVADLSR